MFAYSNYWLDLRQRRLALIEINRLLEKFVGHKVHSKDDLYLSMRKVVIKYFKENADKIRYFPSSLGYDFEIEEIGGYVAEAKFIV